MNHIKIIDEMQSILLPHLCKGLDVKTCIIDFEESDECGCDQAFTLHLGYEELLGCEMFEIEYSHSLLEDEHAFRTMVAHELVHVVQHLRGDVFDHSLPYDEQPHEIEAYALEDELRELSWIK